MNPGGASPVRLLAAISAYDERDLLPGCIDALGAADRIIVVDGAFADYPHDAPVSTDGTLEWLGEAARRDDRIEVISRPDAWESEVAKRSAYLVGRPGDWYVVVDADERLYGGDELKTLLTASEADSWAIPFFDRPSDPSPLPAARVFRHANGIRYETADGRVVADGNVLVNADTAQAVIPYREGVPGPRIIHLQHKRSAERQRMREEYIRRVIEADPSLRDEVRRSGVDIMDAFRRRQSG